MTHLLLKSVMLCTSYCYYASSGVFISKVTKQQKFFVVQASWVVKDLGWQGSSPVPRITARITEALFENKQEVDGPSAKSRVLEKPYLPASGGSGQEACRIPGRRKMVWGSPRAPSRLCLGIFMGSPPSLVTFGPHHPLWWRAVPWTVGRPPSPTY